MQATDPGGPMPDIFLSHASADKSLALALVEFMKEGIGVPEKSIFCTSIKGHDIPLGADFNDYMKKKIQKPAMVLVLMTEAYFERPFCLMELGAAWAQSSDALAIVVPPISFSHVTSTLGLKQAWAITDEHGLIDFKDRLKAAVTTEHRTEHTWVRKQTKWRRDLPAILAGLPKRTQVAASEHEQLQTSLATQADEIAELEAELSKRNAHIAALEKLKNPEAVKALRRKLTDNALEETFNDLMNAIKSAWPNNLPNVVRKHAILDYHNIAGEIDWSNDRHEFTAAVQYKVLDREDDSILWGERKLKPFRKALAALDDFLGSEEAEPLIEAKITEQIPMDAGDREFWEHHL